MKGWQRRGGSSQPGAELANWTSAWLTELVVTVSQPSQYEFPVVKLCSVHLGGCAQSLSIKHEKHTGHYTHTHTHKFNMSLFTIKLLTPVTLCVYIHAFIWRN